MTLINIILENSKMRYLILIFISTHLALASQAQGEVRITDQTLLKVVDQFIDSLQLNTKKYRLIRIEFKTISKEFVTQVDTARSSFISVNEIALAPVSYSLTISSEQMAIVLDVFPPTYYTSYRDIPIIINTGVETFLRTDPKKLKYLKKKLKPYFQYGLSAPPHTWFVKVDEERIFIERIF